MTRFLFPIFLLFLWSCNNSQNDATTESFGENKSEGTVIACLCTDLKKNNNGELLRDGSLFTGNCFLNYENSEAKYIEKQIVNGLINGTIKYYSKTGEIIFEEKFEKGAHQLNLEVESIRCDCAALNKNKKDQKYYYKGQLFKGMCYSLYPDIEQVYIEISYQEGIRNGFTTYFSRLGDILYTEKYDSGALLKVIYPKK